MQNSVTLTSFLFPCFLCSRLHPTMAALRTLFVPLFSGLGSMLLRVLRSTKTVSRLSWTLPLCKKTISNVSPSILKRGRTLLQAPTTKSAFRSFPSRSLKLCVIGFLLSVALVLMTLKLKTLLKRSLRRLWPECRPTRMPRWPRKRRKSPSRRSWLT